MGGTEDQGIAYFPSRKDPETGKFIETLGTQYVGLNFNPSGSEIVHEVKLRFADVIDAMYALRSTTHDPDVKLFCSVAITEAQTAQMWAVKALTWN